MKRVMKVAGATMLLVAFSAVAYAAEHGGEHGLNWMDFIYRCINFALVAGLIVWLAGGKMKQFFKGRSIQIENELADLDTRKVDAEKRLKEIEASISNLEEEKQKILADYKAQGEKLKAAIIEAAEQSAVQIKEQASRTAENEMKQAVVEMRAELAELVTAAAEKSIKEKLSEKDHEKLVDEYLAKVVLN